MRLNMFKKQIKKNYQVFFCKYFLLLIFIENILFVHTKFKILKYIYCKNIQTIVYKYKRIKKHIFI